MELLVIPPTRPLPVTRAYVITMTIKSFKGRKDVEVHLFRPSFPAEEMDQYDWPEIIEDSLHPDVPSDTLPTRKVLLEAFTEEERDKIMGYIVERYEGKLQGLTSCALTFPLPLGLQPLSEIPEGKTIGFIRFESIPNYTLPFPVHGLYDLAQHEPLVQG